jgi:drug/metabolite transporter (DMT)-like permease
MTRRAWLLFVAMSLLWGVPYLLIKIAVSEVDPSFLVFVRLGLSALVLLPLAVMRGTVGPLKRYWQTLVTIGTVGIVLPFLLIAYGEQHITSSLAALLIAADPLFVVLLALRMDATERVSGWRLCGLLLGFVGVAVLLGLNVGGDALGVLGGALVLGAAVCYALSALWAKPIAEVSPLGGTAVTSTIATIALAPLAAFNVPSHIPSAAVLGSMVALGLVCTALAYVVYFSLIGAAGAGRAALITYVNPAVAVLVGALILAEPITVGTIAGFTLIVLGCALSTGAFSRGQRPAESHAVA